MASNRENRGTSIGFFKGLYLDNRFFIVLGILVLVLIVSFVFKSFFIFALALVLAFGILVLLDCLLLFRSYSISATRDLPNRLSNGDENRIDISLRNYYPFKIHAEIIEEAPFQFQERNLIFNYDLNSNQEIDFHYNLIPTQRGQYLFGSVNVFVSSVLSLVKRRYIFPEGKMITVYPSFLSMNRFNLLSSSDRLTDYGVKRIRRIGNATEFEHIKQYTFGDDPRTINYKATARTAELMVNTYIEERAQPVYCIIDKGRTMQMPFKGMSLLDYAINSSLVVANTALGKGDRAGLITFSNTIDDVLSASNRASQRNLILERLYLQKTNYKDADYGALYITLKRVVRQRSLLVLYTNFESLKGLRRQLKYLRLIAKDHLLVVAFFVNSELEDVLSIEPMSLDEYFTKSTAESFSTDKQLIVRELNAYGIYTILSKPEHLTIDSINKYLELKARAII